MLYIDSETCGFHGIAVIMQYAINDSKINIHNYWTHSINDNMALIEMLVNHPGGVCAFNMAFDWFHVCKMYTILHSLRNVLKVESNNTSLSNYIYDIVTPLPQLGGKSIEQVAMDGPCVKPQTAFDIFLHARKTEYQTTMDRKDIKIKKVPAALAYRLADKLEELIPIKDIYFGRNKKKIRKWEVYDRPTEPDWKDIKCKFAPTSALKALAVDALKKDSVITHSEISIDPAYYPNELGYAPFALAVASTTLPNSSLPISSANCPKVTDWNRAWPTVINAHINHWEYNERARQYAGDDVIYLQELYEYFGCPPVGDNDSILACSVAACRWKGYKVDIEGLKQLKRKTAMKRYKKNETERLIKIPTAPAEVRDYIISELSEIEALGWIRESTKKVVLNKIAKITVPCAECTDNEQLMDDLMDFKSDVSRTTGELDSRVTVASKPRGKTDCPSCNGSGSLHHPAAIKAQEVLDARASFKEEEMYDKLIRAGRLHASVKVIGALSGRMSGADGLNPHAIKNDKSIRKHFPLADQQEFLVNPLTGKDSVINPNYRKLCGGDFGGFEVTIAVACYGDEGLRRDLLTCEKCEHQMKFVREEYDFICQNCGSRDGKAIHGYFGTFMYPDMTYEQIKATKGLGPGKDLYTQAKRGVFLGMYGGNEFTLVERLEIEPEIAERAFRIYMSRYPGIRRYLKSIEDGFAAMRQPGGIGTRVEWHEPKESISTLFGFKRWFLLENMICKSLFELAQNVPTEWKSIKQKVRRRDRMQLASGAISSALYAAAFAVQAANLRAAMNHVIQGTGSQITKQVQCDVWELQPKGIHEWIVQPFNCHDELQVPTHPDYVDTVRMTVLESVEKFRETIPLIKMDWSTNLKSWADK